LDIDRLEKFLESKSYSQAMIEQKIKQNAEMALKYMFETYNFDDNKTLKIAFDEQKNKPDFALRAFIYFGDEDFGYGDDSQMHHLFYISSRDKFHDVSSLTDEELEIPLIAEIIENFDC